MSMVQPDNTHCRVGFDQKENMWLIASSEAVEARGVWIAEWVSLSSLEHHYTLFEPRRRQLSVGPKYNIFAFNDFI